MNQWMIAYSTKKDTPHTCVLVREPSECWSPNSTTWITDIDIFFPRFTPSRSERSPQVKRSTKRPNIQVDQPESLLIGFSTRKSSINYTKSLFNDVLKVVLVASELLTDWVEREYHHHSARLPQTRQWSRSRQSRQAR